MPSSAQADLCELALRQVPKYTGHTDGGFVEGTKVGSWPIVRIEHRAGKPPFSQRENNQTPINNKGV